jgi:hypothetical protein
MPFNIELTKSNPIIKLQVSHNTITVYINDTSAAADRAMVSWDHLESHFLNTMPEYNKNWVRGPDAPHVKRNHTSEYEVNYKHFHREFTSEVTPELLRVYLTNLWIQQRSAEHADQNFQFFNGQTEVETILHAFGIYYKEYKGSAAETIFNAEHMLTKDESERYQEAVSSSSSKSSDKDEMDLVITALLVRSMFAGQGQVRIMTFPSEGAPASSAKEADLEKCNVM